MCGWVAAVDCSPSRSLCLHALQSEDAAQPQCLPELLFPFSKDSPEKFFWATQSQEAALVLTITTRSVSTRQASNGSAIPD